MDGSSNTNRAVSTRGCSRGSGQRRLPNRSSGWRAGATRPRPGSVGPLRVLRSSVGSYATTDRASNGARSDRADPPEHPRPATARAGQAPLLVRPPRPCRHSGTSKRLRHPGLTVGIHLGVKSQHMGQHDARGIAVRHAGSAAKDVADGMARRPSARHPADPSSTTRHRAGNRRALQGR
jgi:hypothetical protein